MLSNSYIKESAIKVGFSLVGVTFPRDFDFNKKMIEDWIKRGEAEPLDYMQRYMDVRFNPENIFEGTRSIVVCALNYKNIFSLAPFQPHHPKIASYALNRDYHKVIRKQLKALINLLKQADPTIEGRCCVDTAPLLEKQLAHEAGLGWIGRQSLLITPQHGSYILLGVLLLNCEVDSFDSPLTTHGCGECHRCVENCPTQAITDRKMIDTRRCISAQTVECDSAEGKDLHGWAFGCDECQRCCPYNRNTPLSTNPDIQPIFAPISFDAWHAMSSEEFAEKLNATPIKRGGLDRLLRNIKP